MKRALISVYDKENILDFAKFLVENGVEIISTGGTYKYLKENNIDVLEVSSVTGVNEMLDGRVKTLHPNIHGGILAIRSNENHMKSLKENNIDTIDYVIVNLYPFFEKVNDNISFEEKVEFIDIGGPTMLRSAAKSFEDVVVISDKKDYELVKNELINDKVVSYNTRKYLASKVFNLTSSYDAAIANFLSDDIEKEYLSVSYKKEMNLRYGENSHQKAVFYTDTVNKSAMNNIEKLNGKELSFNNIRDMDLAWKLACEFEKPACVATKHSTPCGVAVSFDVYSAYIKAYTSDPVSIFGGVIAFNKTVDEKTASELVKIFLEIVIAPDFTEKALEVLKTKKNLRVIKCSVKASDKYEYIKVDGGILVQEADNTIYDELEFVTDKKPSEKELDDLEFAMKVCKYVKSNAIVIAKDNVTLGIGGGEVSRIWASENAVERAKKFNLDNLVLASDAFFPFSDVVEYVAKNKVVSIIQPGGSIKDQDSIDKCNELGISMVFSKIRHFKH
ncbi:bifunctional phosphoribosylaminoimidazolecarboxamide formyltransferase/IMP cyclohydrolase [Oceanivirga miroungae]|uniref:Bifunctional purine biosynthesis protein PurH n=2 Tax=Oceanivirga miroungae TaxID=1130046 RepID=A0A6I8M9M6_9FUSO|nr:bifunctional phosphoribosylaminoimidazolecarboxamide formyltransferase/IMP cyclohydrolase [Oceanivirga miroungae]